MGTTVLEVILGAIVAIIITIWIENLRKPKLSIQISTPTGREYKDRPAKRAKFLHAEIKNKPLPKWARWMSRDAATQCHGTITFHHLDGQNIFGRSMYARWGGTPEPTPIQIVFEDKRFLIVDPAKFSINTRMDIYPGESEVIDIAARFDDETECYGWSNENYFSNPIWRNPNWKLPSGRYLVRVVITTSGEKISEVFRLINDVSFEDFRLELKMSKDKVYG